MNEKELSIRDYLTIIIHVVMWGILFFFPYLMMTRGGMDVTFSDYVWNTAPYYIIYIIFFYLNNNLLIPRLLLRRKFWMYVLQLLVLILIASFLSGLLHQIEFERMLISWRDQVPFEYRDYMRPNPMARRWSISMIMGRDFFVMALVATITAVVRVIEAWSELENSKREAEKQRVETELQQLRSQINPHFLLNTLNNIYALIAFDSEKAQEAVHELSQLLRHVLYDNKQNYTTLEKEMQFMKSYIELMRIRLSSNVTIETTYDMRENNQTPIAPLIFISLVENAFKHGISPTEPSYIKIFFSEKLGYVRCEIKNSNHRKVGYDKSGSGIGLEQVQKRLDLMYPGSYVWHYGLSDDGTEYVSSLEINTKNALSLD
ncbi:MAG: histidine kinase [Bacteroidaceae bacterium]|nr:histidine kinase [Bacteroidaceae bacterium]